MADQDLRKQCKELAKKLQDALRERDQLVLDLEAMCLADSNTTFNSSSVLQERIFSTGKRQQGAGGGGHPRSRQRGRQVAVPSAAPSGQVGCLSAL